MLFKVYTGQEVQAELGSRQYYESVHSNELRWSGAGRLWCPPG